MCTCVSLSVASPPSNVTAVQTGPTSITVSWSPSSDATGYRIDYDSSGGDSGNVTVSGGSSDNETLTGLQNGDTYTIFIVTTSHHLSSNHAIIMDVELSKIAVYIFPIGGIAAFISSRPTSHYHEFTNSHLHLPLLEYFQCFSGRQLCGVVVIRSVS